MTYHQYTGSGITYYIWTLNSHELYGPFTSEVAAYLFGQKRKLASFTIYPRSACFDYMFKSLRK